MKIYIILFLSLCYAATSQLQINELCSDNDELLQAADGEYYDWIEIYNNSDNSIQLSDYYLSDDEDDLQKWNFNNENLQAKSFIIIFASDLDGTMNGEQHTNFKLSSNGETLYLSNAESLVDTMEFGSVNEDYTYGRLEENSNIKTPLAKPTPGESNSSSGTIIASRESGYYEQEFDLILTAADGQKIYYTTNGDDPTLVSKLYNGKIEIKDEYEEYEYLDVPTTPLDTNNCKFEWIKPDKNILRCRVISYCIINSNNEKSKVYRKSYFFENKHKLPVISIITDNMSLFSQDTGIYVPGNLFDESNPCWSGNYFVNSWERSASLTYFENEEKIFEENTGIKINGGGTRTLPQKSIKFFARKKYGVNKFSNVFFPNNKVDVFNSLLIRTTMADWNETLIKDALTHSIVKDLNLEPTFIKPVIVYINGNYWGISELRNRLEEDYFSEKYEINKDSINIISIDNPNHPRNGTYDDFAPLYEFIINKDLSIIGNYNYVESRIDINNLIDYFIAEMYFANYDWPGNNFLIWNSSEFDGKYRAIFFDLDGGWNNFNYNMFEHTSQLVHNEWPNPKNINLFFQNLLDNELFKTKFIDRTLYLLENDFDFQIIEPLIINFISKYESEIDNNINRLEFPESTEDWLYNVGNYLIEFARERECHFRYQMKEYFDLDNSILCLGSNVETDGSSTFTLSPNPANNNLRISNLNSDYVIILDLQGAEIMRLNTGLKKSINIDISHLAQGVYYIKSDTKTTKFIRIN